MNSLISTGEIESMNIVYNLKSNEKSMMSATWKMGILCFVFIVIDFISILSRLIWGADYRWPYIYNDFVAWLWGPMGFLLSISHIKNIWLLWFRDSSEL